MRRDTVSVFDRAYLYGDGIFDTMRAYNGEIFRFEEHLKRLKKNARALGIDCKIGDNELKDFILKGLKENMLNSLNLQKDAYIRITLSRGSGLGPEQGRKLKPGISMIIRPSRLYPQYFYKYGVEILIGATRRLSPFAVDGKIKSINYLNSILAREEASRKSAFETVLLSEDGYVTEGSSSNIFIVKNGASLHETRLITPPSFLGVLEGITRNVALEIAESLGIKTELVPFTAYDVYTADECFLTSTGIEIMPVRTVDKREIGVPGPVTQKIRKEFLKITRLGGG